MPDTWTHTLEADKTMEFEVTFSDSSFDNYALVLYPKETTKETIRLTKVGQIEKIEASGEDRDILYAPFFRDENGQEHKVKYVKPVVIVENTIWELLSEDIGDGSDDDLIVRVTVS